MSKQDDKRARIIAEQVAREAADRAAGRVPALPEPRANWAASSAKPGQDRTRRKPASSGRRF